MYYSHSRLETPLGNSDMQDSSSEEAVEVAGCHLSLDQAKQLSTQITQVHSYVVMVTHVRILTALSAVDDHISLVSFRAFVVSSVSGLGASCG